MYSKDSSDTREYKKQRRARYEASQSLIDEVLGDELKDIKFPVKPVIQKDING